MLRNLTRIRNSRNYTTTVDKDEISHFKKFAEDWWNTSGSMRPLHELNTLRVPLITNGLVNTQVIPRENIQNPLPLKGLSVLDVGCGGGILTEAIARIGAKVTGLDPNSELIKLAQNHSKQENLMIDYVNTSIEEHSGNYDAVVSSEVLEHVNNKAGFLDACLKCLKPGGSIFLTTINKTVLADLLAIKLLENVLKLIPKGTHEYEKFIEPHKVKGLLEQKGCRTILTHGMIYNPLTNKWFWSKNTIISYALHAVKLETP